ncbi:PKD domain-containing protein [bacterium]|nr:PKD domain-containing protein [bacterium]
MFKLRICTEWIRVYLAFLLGIFSLALNVYASESEWWNTDWKYRSKLVVLTHGLKTDIDTASFLFYPVGRVNKNLSDIRIIDEQGRQTPYKVSSNEEENLIIDFKVDNASKCEYYMYFGNPKAEKIEYMLRPTASGLFLETREKARSSHPRDWSQMQTLIQQSTKIYGKGPRCQIDDLENPFGSNENYLSIYRGTIFCPLDGKYGFATNSDDASFLLVDGKLAVSWPGGHEKEGKGRPLIDKWTHQGEIYLEKGVHLIQYYQEEGTGTQLSRAGWKKPGDKDFMIIPKEAFIDKLKARQASLQAYGKPLNAFFFTEEKESMRFNRQTQELISFQFQDASISKDSGTLSYQWDFGDGSTSSERNPLHIYPADSIYKVRLQVKNVEDLMDIYEKYIQVHPRSQPKSIQLEWRVTNTLNIFYPQELLQLGVWIKNYSDTGAKLKLVWESLDNRGDKIKQGSRELVLEPNQAEKVDIPPARFIKDKSMDFYLSYGGNIITKKKIEFLDVGSEFKGLRIVEGHIEDSENSLVLFRISQTKAPAYRPHRTQNKANIVILGASFYNKDDNDNCWKILSGLLKNYYGNKVKVNLNYVEISEDAQVSSGLLGICRLEEAIKQNPDLVLFSLGMNEVISHLSLGEFKRCLTFLTTAIKSRGIRTVLVIPPPVIDKVIFSMDIAIAVKEVGLRQAVEMVDLFSAFPREETALSLLYQSDFCEKVHLLYPRRAGQSLIAKQIFETVKKNVPKPEK